jgi:hypothetical protein
MIERVITLIKPAWIDKYVMKLRKLIAKDLTKFQSIFSLHERK